MGKRKEGPAAPRRMVLSDESLNGRGFRVLTAGIRLGRYAKNPVLLWMHRRGEVVGVVDDLQMEDGVLSGVPKFDGVTEQSRQLEAQYAAGSVRACSMGIDVLRVETETTLEGLERPVVTECELYEVSLVDVPENENSVQLRHQGKPIDLSGLVHLSHECCKGVVAKEAGSVAAAKPQPAEKERKPVEKGDLPNPNIHLKNESMTLSEMAVLLGLDSGASEEAVRARAQELVADRAELSKVTAELKELKEVQATAELAHVERLVNAAVSDMRITADKKARYVELGKQIGSSALEAVLGDLRPVGRLVETLQHGNAPGACAWKKLSDVPPSELTELKKTDRALYARLYKAEYGVDLEGDGE